MIGHSSRHIPRLPLSLLWLLLGTIGQLTGCASKSQPEEQGLEAARKNVLNEEPQTAATPRRKAARDAQASYTIARGGTVLNVANLYKLHHHEILKLNPDLKAEQQLPARTQIVVYENAGSDSESLGSPSAGSVVGAMPMLDGPGRRITAERWKTWGTRHSVLSLDRVLKRWQEKFAKAPPILVGNMSARHGGPLAPHKTHQSGRDVDLSYIQKWDGEEVVTWQHMTAHNFDAKRMWQFLKVLTTEAEVEVMFMDRTLQKLLLKYAKRHQNIRKNELEKWLEVSAKKTKKPPLIQHIPGHKDHLHVRFACPASQSRCKS